jgi:hypothetical protein
MILDPSGQPIGRTLTPEEAVAECAAEMLAMESDPMAVAFRPITAFQIAGMLQLALRHPDLSGELRDTAWGFLDAVREYFADCPAVLTILEAGDDPTQDVHVGGG